LTIRFARLVVTTALGATVYGTLPLPCPLVEEEAMPSQSASVFTVQEHSRLMVIDNVPLPPAASAVGRLAASVAAQRDDVGAVTLVDDDEPQLALRTLRIRATAPINDVNRVCVIGPRATNARR
jgi:hypothetical protein